VAIGLLLMWQEGEEIGPDNPMYTVEVVDGDISIDTPVKQRGDGTWQAGKGILQVHDLQFGEVRRYYDACITVEEPDE